MSEAGYPGYDGPTVTLDEQFDTIQRAVDYLRSTDRQVSRGVLAGTEIHQHLKDDPDALADKLIEAIRAGHTFGAWKAAQQILGAAGPLHHVTTPQPLATTISPWSA